MAASTYQVTILPAEHPGGTAVTLACLSVDTLASLRLRCFAYGGAAPHRNALRVRGGAVLPPAGSDGEGRQLSELGVGPGTVLLSSVPDEGGAEAENEQKYGQVEESIAETAPAAAAAAAAASTTRGDGSMELFDAVSRVHDTWVDEGRREAVIGLEDTDEDAERLGLHHGSRLGYELSYIEGVIVVLERLCGTGGWPPLSKRGQDTAASLRGKLAAFPLDKPASNDFQVQLDTIRADFRKLCAQAKIPNVHTWQTGGVKRESTAF